jgi:NAD(P)-dependent dehydrogenase (short-subunit alcohol dehydrogenase family)
MSLKGKVYALTGGASGIGFATAKVLAQRGATLSIADIDPDAMSTATAYFNEQGIEALVSHVDVSQRSQVEDWLDATIKKYGRLDGAANVAGIIGKHHGLRAVADLEDEEWHKIIAVNLTGTMYCLRAQLNRIVDGGSIVNVASIHGIKGTLQTAHSGISKTDQCNQDLPSTAPMTPANME